MRLVELPPWVIYPILFFVFYISFFYLIVWLTRKNEVCDAKKPYPTVSFVIPAKNEEKRISKCIISIIKQSYPGKIIALIVNDASTDNTIQVVKKLQRKYAYLKNRKILILNRKKSQGKKAPVINEGLKKILKEIKSPYISVLDADTMITKEVVKKSVGLFQKDKDIYGITSPLVPYNRNKLLLRLQYIELLMSSFFRNLMGRVNAVTIVPAFSIFRLETFRKLGFYDENNWTEDFEMALRIRSKYFKIAFLDVNSNVVMSEKLKKVKRERLRWAYGTYQNLLKYKHMISPKYGAVGTFFLPIVVVIGLFILMFSLFLFFYEFIYRINMIVHFFILGIDPFLELSISWSRVFLTISDPATLLIFMGVILSLLFFVFAQHELKERINLIDYFLFIFVYSWFLAYVQFEALIRYLLGIKIKW